MEKNIEQSPVQSLVCDSCGERAILKCYFCGKDLCHGCAARVKFLDKETVRGKGLLFFYDKPMCKSHLPERRDCE